METTHSKLGYKAFNQDFTCRGFQYEVGKVYEIDGKPRLCGKGFHYCPIAKDVLEYYPATSRFAEIEDLGKTVTGDDKNCTNKIKIVRELNRAEMIELCGFEKNNLGKDNFGDNSTGNWNTGDSNTGHRNTGDSNTGNSNTGDSNTGHRNTGHWNTGNWSTGHNNTGDSNTGHRNTGNWNTGNWNTGDSNTGHRNTGDNNTGDSNTGHRNTGDSNTGHRNTGHWNTGNWNTGDNNTGDNNTGNWNTGDSNTGHRNTGDNNTGNWNKADFQAGFFNTKTPETIDVFNKKCSRKKWNKTEKPRFIYRVRPSVWVNWYGMTDQEKANHPQAETQDGYLKSISMEDAWAEAFKTATDEDIRLLKALPNYDFEVFKEITGIDDERLR